MRGKSIKFLSFVVLTLSLLYISAQAMGDDVIANIDKAQYDNMLIFVNNTEKKVKADGYFDSIMSNYINRLSEQCIFNQRMPSVLYNFMRINELLSIG